MRTEVHGSGKICAKLKLNDTGQSPGYSLEQLFDDPPALNDDYVLTQLREVEVDSAGNVYVLNCQYNSSDVLWMYQSDGQLAARQELQQLGISAPTGLCVSSYDPSRSYLASCENPSDANSVKLYVLATDENLTSCRRQRSATWATSPTSPRTPPAAQSAWQAA